MERLADEARDNTIQSANEQYEGIKNKAISELGAASVWIDQNNGNLLAKEEDFAKSWRKSFESAFAIKIPSAFEKIVKWLADLTGKTITIDAQTKITGVNQGQQLATKYMFGSTLPNLAGYSANGAIFNSGDIFSSRENGMPELVGRYGNQTGVMNNDQIVSSVASGVASAVKSVLGGGMGGGDWHIYVVDDRGTVTGNTIVTAAQRKNLRDGKTTLAIG